MRPYSQDLYAINPPLNLEAENAETENVVSISFAKGVTVG